MTELSKSYDPSAVESHWRTFWEENKTFMADPSREGEAFSIVIPPPNVTGALHMGHALNLTLQDVLCRHARQLGKNVLWLPGTDHAGIATQNVVERALAKDGKSRHELGREAFIEEVWKWRNEYGTRITQQIRYMGASVDWSRERFTMDEGLSKAVRKVFVELYNQGLIYKGRRIINWCVRCHTALADDEVEHNPSKGNLTHVRYELEDGSGSIVIATTRPETIVADTAVAVHPEDERYAAFVGKNIIVPIVNRPVPIIADSYVDKDFGTGALKVTPCHDHNDWALGEKHNLAQIQAIDEDGKMNEEAGPYVGMSKEDCRKKISEDLEKEGRIVCIETIENNVGQCYRCKTVVEPHVSDQWFVAATKLAPRARAAVPEIIGMFPEGWIKTYYHWLDTIRDWCISRQIWWGHRIPAWTCQSCQEICVQEEGPTQCPKCQSTDLLQEEDVLDTWFSSALWPFSTMGWPDNTAELARYYPTSVLVTSFDILFFWVARMIMMGQHFMGEIPFHHVYLHALVRDSEGNKMSKSSGNVIDPIDMIGNYGTDALRFALTAFAAMGRDIRLAKDRIEGYRHFVNKLWNAARFVLMNLSKDIQTEGRLEQVQALHHKWILHRLEEVKDTVKASLAEYRFNDAAQSLYGFLWHEFCDWYVELCKGDFNKEGQVKQETEEVLYTVLQEILVLLHPIIPFVSAEIWQALPQKAGTDIATVLYPQSRPACLDEKALKNMLFVQEVIVAIRTVRSELSIAPSVKVAVRIKPFDEAQAQLLEESKPWLMALGRLESADIDAKAETPEASASSLVDRCEVIVLLEGAFDFQAEVARLDKELAKLDKEYTMLTQKLANESFVSRAPAELVQQQRDRVAELSANKETLLALHKRFKALVQ